MDDDTIYRLFSRVAEGASKENHAAREVFSTLIRATLKYRDIMLASKKIVVTVADVRAALDWLIPALNSGGLPQTDNKISFDLLKLWLDELKYLKPS
ncbi:MAG: hypothetical protein JW932_03575 [Deltaproteobacteria bacterium]|nr:hypothetical protein [Deltaproteobacteria bacterium]